MSKVIGTERIREILGSLSGIAVSPQGSGPPTDRQFLANPGTIFENELPIGERPPGFYWCPDGIPPGKTTALLSSRLGSSPFLRSDVARVLRSFYASLPEDSLLLTGAGTTLEGAVRRGSQLFDLPLLSFQPFPVRFNAEIAAKIAARRRPGNEFRVFADLPGEPDFDSLILRLCQQVRVLSLRKGGKIHNLLKRRVNDSVDSDRHCVVFVLVDAALVPPELHDDLRQHGVHSWWLYPAVGDAKENSSGNWADPDRNRGLNAGDWLQPEDLKGDYLSHWTREPRDHWPDRSSDNQWDVAFFAGGVPRGPLGSLIRILARKTILASGRLVRDGWPVCSFTGVPLSEFPSRRKFRRHLARWDFEPFGIAIRREVMEGLGARPVRYLRDETESANTPGDACWTVTDPKGEWEQEKEWRFEGDLDLNQIPCEAAAVFVPDEITAIQISSWSRWPIVVLRGNRAGNG